MKNLFLKGGPLGGKDTTDWLICCRYSANVCWSILKPLTFGHIKRLGLPRVRHRGR